MTHLGVQLNDGRVELAASSAAEILGSLARYRRPAVATFNRPGATCRLHTRAGVLWAASGPEPANRLGERLCELGSLEPAVLDSTLVASRASDRRVGAVLLERGHVPPVELREGLLAQLNEAVRQVLTWRDGEVELAVSNAAQEEGEVHVSVPIRRAVLRGLKLATDVEPLVERLGGASQRLEPCYELDEVIDAALGEREFELLRLVDGKRTVEELSAVGPFREAKNLRVVVALWALQLVRPVQGRMIRFPEVPSSSPERASTESADVEALLRRAMEHYVSGDFGAALSVLERCLEIDPDHRRARHNRDRVRARIDER